VLPLLDLTHMSAETPRLRTQIVEFVGHRTRRGRNVITLGAKPLEFGGRLGGQPLDDPVERRVCRHGHPPRAGISAARRFAAGFRRSALEGRGLKFRPRLNEICGSHFPCVRRAWQSTFSRQRTAATSGGCHSERAVK
jgi:hypothetical protein